MSADENKVEEPLNSNLIDTGNSSHSENSESIIAKVMQITVTERLKTSNIMIFI